MKKLLIILFAFISLNLSAQIVADHEAVSRYRYIPQQYIDSVKKMLVWVPGMSHGYGYFRGAELLDSLDNTFSTDLWYNTSAPAESSTGLRLGRPGLGSEGMWTSDTWFGINEDYISDQNETGNRFNSVLFGWSYQATWDNPPGGGLDSVYNVHWAGRTDDGPDGSLRWGLDAADEALTGNSVCMDTYLNRYVGSSPDIGYTEYDPDTDPYIRKFTKSKGTLRKHGNKFLYLK